MLKISNAMMFQFYAYHIFLEAIRHKNSVPHLPPTQTQISTHPGPQKIEQVLIRDFTEDGVFLRVFSRNVALLHLRVFL